MHEAPRPRMKSFRLGISVFAALMAFATVSRADEVVVPGDSLAIDQPRVLFGLEDPANPGVLVGPDFFNDGLLDTGANGVVLTKNAYFDLDILDYDPALYDVAQRTDGSDVQYEEIGVAGTSFFDVLEPYDLNFAGIDATTHAVPNVTALGAFDLDTGSFAAILGMPVMQNRVTQINLRPNAVGGLQEVSFHSTQPVTTADTYTVNLSTLPPEFSGQIEPTDPLPTYTGLPMLDVHTQANGNQASNTLILDTGAQFTILSETMAVQMGLNMDPNDPNTDIIDFLTVGGIGGEVDVPFVQLERFIIPTEEGVDLVFTDVQVGILDISGLGGVVGMNILTSGYTDLLFGTPGPGQYGVFGDIFLDFTDPGGVLRFEMNPEFNNVVPEPVTLWLAGLAMLAIRRRRHH